MLIVENGRLISRSKISPYPENGALALDGDTVKETGALEAMRAKYPDAEFVDARACAYTTVLDFAEPERGARFGSNELLYPIDGVPMIERAFSAVPPEPFDRACVVSRYPEGYIRGEVRGYHAIFNPRAAKGQSTSIRLGLSALLFTNRT